MIKLKIVSLYSLTERTLIESVVYAIAEKFLGKAEIEEIREAIKMTTIEQIIEKLMENFSLSRENAEKYMEEFNSQKSSEK